VFKVSALTEARRRVNMTSVLLIWQSDSGTPLSDCHINNTLVMFTVTSHWEGRYTVKAVHMVDNSGSTSRSLISCLGHEIFVQINHILTKYCPWKLGVPVIMTHHLHTCPSVSTRFAGRERTWWGMGRRASCRCLRIWHLRTTSTTASSVRLSSRGVCAYVPFRSPTRAPISALCWPIRTVERRIIVSSPSSVCIGHWCVAFRLHCLPRYRCLKLYKNS